MGLDGEAAHPLAASQAVEETVEKWIQEATFTIGASRQSEGKTAVITAYPATESWDGKKTRLG